MGFSHEAPLGIAELMLLWGIGDAAMGSGGNCGKICQKVVIRYLLDGCLVRSMDGQQGQKVNWVTCKIR